MRESPAHGSWDHIVVGGGSSGAALAARLSEDPDRRVLLLEAGADYPSVEQIPAEMLARAVSDTTIHHDWRFTAEPVPGREIAYPVGKVTGGSSAVNSAVALRGAPADYDEWAAAGNPGWAWEDVLPFFVRLESDRDFGGQAHGSDGPIPIQRPTSSELLHVHRALLDAAVELGHPHVPDLNAPETIGAGPWPMNVQGSVRVSTAIAYLTPAVRARPNLRVRSQVPVARVIFEARRAVGVELAGGQEIRAADVTLCAGAICTPGILLRSGIGAAERVQAAGADVLSSRVGVGEHLMDHAFVWLCAVPSDGVCDLRARSVQAGVRYTATGSAESGDMQMLVVIPVDLSATPVLAERAGARRVFMIGAGLQRPRARGRVTWTGPDPLRAPRIELNLTGDPHDMERLRDGVRRAWEMAHSRQMAPHLRRVALLDADALDDDAALDRYIGEVVMTFKHASGTARMGPAGDPGAVVDAQGSVHGVQGLRVADMSIAPNIPRANTNLTAIMIGERVADLMRSLPPGAEAGA